MKKTILTTASLLVLCILLPAMILFFRPGLILNVTVLDKILEKTGILKSWSWDKGSIDHQWVTWGHRVLSGDFKNFCFVYDKHGMEVNSCLQNLSWKFAVKLAGKGAPKVESIEPLAIESERLSIQLPPPSPDFAKDKEASEPQDIKKMWDTFWGRMVPDFYVSFDRIDIRSSSGKSFSFDLFLEKSGETFAARSMEFALFATPGGFRVSAPKRYELPFDIPLLGAVEVKSFTLDGEVEDNEIKAKADANVLGMSIKAKTKIDLPVNDAFSSVPFLKQTALNTNAVIKVDKIKSRIEQALEAPYNKLPAPFNTMDGSIKIEAGVKDAPKTEEIEINVTAVTDMDGPKQELDFQTVSKIVFDLEKKKTGAILFDLDVKKIVLQIPRLPKTSLPPQFFPDGRIFTEGVKMDEKLAQRQTEENPLDLNMRLTALGSDTLGFRTNLLDSLLRFNFDLQIERGELKGGYVKTIPLRTEFFKRDVELNQFDIGFDIPEEPTVKARILFHLPEYTVTIYLEGPLSKPRHHLSSEPPLPVSDIYSVLLFGRPMIDTGGANKNALERTNQVLSQGLLSLSVLYFLSDTPIQAIIYDPDSDQVSAQIGLGDKRSLELGKGSVGVRQSLGGGWYVNTTTNSEAGYGLILERIKAY